MSNYNDVFIRSKSTYVTLSPFTVSYVYSITSTHKKHKYCEALNFEFI